MSPHEWDALVNAHDQAVRERDELRAQVTLLIAAHQEQCRVYDGERSVCSISRRALAVTPEQLIEFTEDVRELARFAKDVTARGPILRVAARVGDWLRCD